MDATKFLLVLCKSTLDEDPQVTWDLDYLD